MVCDKGNPKGSVTRTKYLKRQNNRCKKTLKDINYADHKAQMKIKHKSKVKSCLIRHNVAEKRSRLEFLYPF